MRSKTCSKSACAASSPTWIRPENSGTAGIQNTRRQIEFATGLRSGPGVLNPTGTVQQVVKHIVGVMHPRQGEQFVSSHAQFLEGAQIGVISQQMGERRMVPEVLADTLHVTGDGSLAWRWLPISPPKDHHQIAAICGSKGVHSAESCLLTGEGESAAAEVVQMADVVAAVRPLAT